MATTQTATVGRISTSNARDRLIVGIAGGALIVGMIGAFLVTRDDGAAVATSAGVSTYSLSKVLGAETYEVGSSFGVASLPAPAAIGRLSYSLTKLQQAERMGVDNAGSASSGYTTAKVDQMQGEGSASHRAAETEPAGTDNPGAGISGSPHLPGLAE